MTRSQSGMRLAQALAVIALMAGMSEQLGWRQGERQPRWVGALEALRSCPLPSNREVWLVPPQNLDPTQAQWLLMELFWQFPHVRWQPARDGKRWVLTGPGVTLEAARQRWQGGGWSLVWVEPSP